MGGGVLDSFQIYGREVDEKEGELIPHVHYAKQII